MKRSFKIVILFLLAIWYAGPAIALEALRRDAVVSVITGDWNDDGNEDAAIISAPGDGGTDYGVSVYLKDRPDGRLRQAFERLEFLWGADTIAGQEPALQVVPNGSFMIITKNDSIGRNRWRQKLTIAYRDSAFFVAGFTYEHFDTLNLKERGPDTCDLNLFSGKGFVNEGSIAFPGKKISLSEWADDTGLNLCDFE